MSAGEVLTLVLAVIAILISVIVGGISLYTANSARDSADAAQKQAASSAEQAIAVWEQVKVAYRQLEQADVARRESLEPYVVVNIEPSANSHQMLLLTIENIGPSVARDVRILPDPPLRRSYEKEGGPATPIMSWHIFTNGIAMLPPRRRIELPFDIIRERLPKGDLPDRYRFTVEATGPFGPVQTMIYDVDLSVYKHEYVDDLTTHHVAKALREIEDTLSWFRKRQHSADAQERHDAFKATLGTADGQEDDE
jgi:hypothetical protein